MHAASAQEVDKPKMSKFCEQVLQPHHSRIPLCRTLALGRISLDEDCLMELMWFMLRIVSLESPYGTSKAICGISERSYGIRELIVVERSLSGPCWQRSYTLLS